MKQILQNLENGDTVLEDVPCPRVRKGHLLIRTTTSLVSAGTERMLVDFGKANLINKARQQPDKVRMVLDKIKTDGLAPTIDAVRGKLSQPLPLGYCNVGVVIEVGAGVSGFSVGDRIASNGKHAEVVCVPKNLCVRIPDAVSDEAAAFTVIGAIALQGIRLAQPTLGETAAVTGLGLIGLVAVQLLRAQGCRVMGIDFDTEKVQLARRLGAGTVDLSRGEDPIAAAAAFSRGNGIDAVLITAATKSNEPVHQAAVMSRKRGRIVLVGVAGLELSRADFFEKELSFQVSCSYGPGRYDPEYEEAGHDYPFGLVRWTEQRNLEAVLDMMADGRIDTESLVSHRYSLADAEQAYATIAGGDSTLGVILQYPLATDKPADTIAARTVALVETQRTATPQTPVIGFIGSGSYATRVLIPAFSKTSARLRSVASNTGISSVHAGKKFGIEQATTDTASVIEDPSINTIVITTRHDTHARFVCDALRNGKHVFVEKPLALDRGQMDDIRAAYEQGRAGDNNPLLMVGFNRRFSPQGVKMRTLLAAVPEPKSFIMTVNAGSIPAEHWTQDRSTGGGRIIGEACHFIDLLRFLAGSAVVSFQAITIGDAPGISIRDDKVSIQLAFADGSFGTIHYLANGNKAFPKERLEIFCAGRILQLENFRKLTGFGWPGFRKLNLWRQDKGNEACAAAFISAIEKGAASPIPYAELEEVSNITIDVADSLY